MKFQIHPVAFGVSEQYYSDAQVRKSISKASIQSRRKIARVVLATSVFFVNFLLWYFIISLF